jgi:hypothetical protein
MATQAPAAAFGPGVRRIEAWETIDALPCSTGNSATPGNESCPRLEFPQFTQPLCREPHIPGTGSDLPVTILAV